MQATYAVTNALGQDCEILTSGMSAFEFFCFGQRYCARVHHFVQGIYATAEEILCPLDASLIRGAFCAHCHL